jgi:diguanylate cyclase (GGDEF)-like protein/PAS domain S-box-containing protein
VTEMRKTAKKNKSRMVDSAELAKALMHCPGLAIYIVQDGRFQYVSSLFQELTGYTEHELLDVYPLDLVHPEDRRLVREKAIENLKGNLVLPYEYRFIKKNGKEIWVSERLASIRYRGKQAAVGSFMDITERKKAEEALADEVSRRRLLFDQSRDGIFVLDENGKVYEANQRFAEMLGYSPEEVPQLHMWDFDAQLTREELLQMARDVNDTGSHVESRLRRKDGTVFDAEISASGAIYAGHKISFCMCHDITERRQFEQKLAEMATHDSLTELPNRTLLNDRFTVALALSRRTRNKLAVMMLDLDRFKSVNDNVGHDVGDKLLKAVGQRLKVTMRESDTVARIGGDEFVVLLSQIRNADEAAKSAQRILDAFREPFVFDGHQLNITTSIGIAIYPKGGKDIESLLKTADTAMYRAKEQGRDTYRFCGAKEATLLAKQVRVCT